MDHVVDVVFFNETFIVLIVSDVKLLIFAWKVKLLVGQISGDDIVTTELFAESSH